MRVRAGLIAALAALAAAGSAHAATKALPALTPVGSDSLTRALASGRIGEARYALERASTLFDRRSVAATFGPVERPAPEDATLVLRDLVLRLGELAPADRERAETLLARPDDPESSGGEHTYTATPATPICTEHFCVHYVVETGDAPVLTDADGNAVPDQIDLTVQVLEQVWAKEIDDYGFRPPKPDDAATNHGPDGRLDVYIADVGADSLYGYCASDDPKTQTLTGPWDYSAYCVLDNDFSPSQFSGGATGAQALEVTAAHEFFHAVQFAYDFAEDRWFMEGTSTWMEDEVYDDVNDNYQYLASSALSDPSVPLDLAIDPSSEFGTFQYGSFVFFRYLSESLQSPLIVRRAWEWADGSKGAPDKYSWAAIKTALKENGQTIRAAFARFGAVNAVPAAFYEEGAAYPTPPVKRALTLNALPRPVSGKVTLSHLTTSYARFAPDAGVADAQLRLTLDLPPRTRGTEASLLLFDPAGTPTIVPLKLTKAGDGVATVPFGTPEVAAVQLVLTNASGRFRCLRDTPFSCSGASRDDRLVFRYRAEVIPAAAP